MTDLKLSDFHYILPDERIAQAPAEPRDSSRLLIVDKNNGQFEDKIFRDIGDILTENDVLVVNQTHVLKARLKGFIIWSEKTCEIFLHKQISENTWECLVYPGKKLKIGVQVRFNDSILVATIISQTDHGRIVEFSLSGKDFFEVLEAVGETPLPPYIKDRSSPDERYQTVYHDKMQSGSVAAPTAGLHFTPELLEKLDKKWVKIEKVTLHVWLWTFKNVEVEYIKNHTMHSEQIYIDEHVAHRLNDYKAQGKRIIAVGTTSVRTLESLSNEMGFLEFWKKDTSIFIYPGYKWKFVDSIITNFHLPESTLLMLVSSFAGYETIQKAYRHAIDSEYRFFSFWDAMWIK